MSGKHFCPHAHCGQELHAEWSYEAGDHMACPTHEYIMPVPPEPVVLPVNPPPLTLKTAQSLRDHADGMWQANKDDVDAEEFADDREWLWSIAASIEKVSELVRIDAHRSVQQAHVFQALVEAWDKNTAHELVAALADVHGRPEEAAYHRASIKEDELTSVAKRLAVGLAPNMLEHGLVNLAGAIVHMHHCGQINLLGDQAVATAKAEAMWAALENT